MNNTFYETLKKPIIAISPMDGVTDATYRYVHAKYSNPDILYTEFVATDGIVRGIVRMFEDLIWHDQGIPIVAQIFGNIPENFFETAQIICELGFDGIDINMGCPARGLNARGGGASLIKDPDNALQIIQRTKDGVDYWLNHGLIPNGNFINEKLIKKVMTFKDKLISLDTKNSDKFILHKTLNTIPVSVKTRIGYKESEVENWTQTLIKGNPAVITMHGRTYKQLYTGNADWNTLKTASEIIHKETDQILFFANGDIKSPESAKKCLEITQADGLLVGRATYGEPYLIANIKNLLKQTNIPTSVDFEVIKRIMYEHAELHISLKGEKLFHQMRKHLTWYIKGFPGASDLRSKLVRTNNLDELRAVLE